MSNIEGNLALKQDLEKDLKDKVNSVAIIPVTNPESFADAGALCKQIVQVEKAVKEYWDPIKTSAHETWKGIVAKEKAMLEPLTTKKEDQMRLMRLWERAEEEKRLELERKAQEEARKLAEEQTMAQAEMLDNQGRKDEASAVLDNPLPQVSVVVPSSVPKGYGSFTRKSYSAEVENIMLLAKAVVEGKVPVNSIQGNSVFLNNQARMMKENFKYPGVKLICK